MDGTYLSVLSAASALIKIEGSRFLADIFPVETEQDASAFIDVVRKKYFDATHHCYSFVIGAEGKLFRYSDDGEPSGTAGIKIHSALQSKHLSDVLCVVTRYYGGTKLGVGGLGRAYHVAAKECIANALIITKAVMQEAVVQFPFTETNTVMNFVHSHKFIIADQQYLETGTKLSLLVPPSNIEKIRMSLIDASRGTIQISIGDQKRVVLS